MKKRIGTYVKQSITGESYYAYIPSHLPPEPPLDLHELYPLLDKATQSLAELKSLSKAIPNISLFIYMYVRKEALLSSQIEGTQSSFSDLILFEHHQNPHISIDDVEEVSNYVKAINYGLERLRNGFPSSLRLIREIHGILLQGRRGAQKQPGEFRTSQNWIGGTRPGNALFVPPPPARLTECLGDFENFLHDDNRKLPILVKIALAHVQFETIHPFLDGNGRLGRLLITLLLCYNDILHDPILYLSLYLKQHRQTYYNLLQEIRTQGSWETWIEFFLEAIHKTSQQAIHNTEKINTLFDNDIKKIQTLGRSKFSCMIVFDYLKILPQISVPLLVKELSLSAPTARQSINQLIRLDILKEVTGKKRDRIYVYDTYLSILEEGTEPLSL